jgi:hypothetical protein
VLLPLELSPPGMISLADSTADSTPDFACSTTPLATRDTRSATDRARLAMLPAAFVTALRPGSPPLRAVERLREVAALRVDFFADDFLADDFLADDFLADDFLAGDFLAGDFLADDFFAEDFLAEDFLADDFLPPFRAGPRELDFRAPPLLRADFIPRDADLRDEDLRAGPLRPLDLRPAPPLFLPVFEPPRDDFLAAAILSSSNVGVLLRHYSNFRAQKTTVVLIPDTGPVSGTAAQRLT